jgi:hypothetical protein
MRYGFWVLANTIAALVQKNQHTRLAIYLLVFDYFFKSMTPDYKGDYLTREDLAHCFGIYR